MPVPARTPAGDPPTHPAYRADIDGLRAIAVLLVVGFHAFPTLFKGGFIGVDIFFVISGYLISGIILRDLQYGRFGYGRFYERRIKRIVPALLLVLLAGLGAGSACLLADEFQSLGKHVLAGGGFLSNFLLWGEAGYFDASADSKPLLHLWSLAVEEQYYLVWPLLLRVAWQRRISLGGVCLLVGVGSFAVSVLASLQNPTAAFYSPLSRFWELMLGGGVAWLAASSPPGSARRQRVLSGLGFGMIAAGALLLNRSRSFPGGWALLPTLGTALLIAGGPNTWLNRILLSHRLLVGVGLISYPLYLWHWPLLSFIRVWNFYGVMLNRGLKCAAVLAAFVLAYLTYRFVERPVRRSELRGLPALLLGGMAFTAALGAFALFSRPPADDIADRYLAAANDWDYPSVAFDGRRVRTGVLEGTSTDSVLFSGDSHMSQFFPAIKSRYVGRQPRYTSIFTSHAQCAPSPRTRLTSSDKENPHFRCDELFRAVMEIARRNEVKAVVFAGNWNVQRLGHYTPDSLREFGAAIRDLTTRGKRVFVLLDNPQGPEFDPKHMLRRRKLDAILGRGVRASPQELAVDIEGPRRRSRGRMANLAQVVVENGGTAIDPYEFLCAQGRCPVLEGGQPVYRDSNHLRPFYAVKHAAALAAAIAFE